MPQISPHLGVLVGPLLLFRFLSDYTAALTGSVCLKMATEVSENAESGRALAGYFLKNWSKRDD